MLACRVIASAQWDQCGEMLTTAGMGGMDEMGQFYDHCLEALYPPGSCAFLPHTIATLSDPLLSGLFYFNLFKISSTSTWR